MGPGSDVAHSTPSHIPVTQTPSWGPAQLQGNQEGQTDCVPPQGRETGCGEHSTVPASSEASQETGRAKNRVQIYIYDD